MIGGNIYVFGNTIIVRVVEGTTVTTAEYDGVTPENLADAVRVLCAWMGRSQE